MFGEEGEERVLECKQVRAVQELSVFFSIE